MASDIFPYQMSRALEVIHRLRAIVEWRCTRNAIRLIHEALQADFVHLTAAVDALERAFQGEKDKPIVVSEFWSVIKLALEESNENNPNRTSRDRL